MQCTNHCYVFKQHIVPNMTLTSTKLSISSAKQKAAKPNRPPTSISKKATKPNRLPNSTAKQKATKPNRPLNSTTAKMAAKPTQLLISEGHEGREDE